MYERRTFVEPIEFRGDREGGKLIGSGVAIRYDTRSKVLAGPKGAFREEIRAGAATKTIAEQDVVALHEHDPKLLLGRSSAGTLRLFDTPDALRYEIDLPDTTVGRDVGISVERRDLVGASFGFRALPSSVEWSTDDGLAIRSIGAIQLRDVSTTAFPAYGEATSAEMALRSEGVDGTELRSLLEAAERGELPTLIALRHADEGEHQEEEHDDDRVTIVDRARLSYLYA